MSPILPIGMRLYDMNSSKYIIICKNSTQGDHDHFRREKVINEVEMSNYKAESKMKGPVDIVQVTQMVL